MVWVGNRKFGHLVGQGRIPGLRNFRIAGNSPLNLMCHRVCTVTGIFSTVYPAGT